MIRDTLIPFVTLVGYLFLLYASNTESIIVVGIDWK